jgi:LemA protein
MEYNISREKFPNVIIAGSMGFAQAPLFEVEAKEERQAPKVKF